MDIGRISIGDDFCRNWWWADARGSSTFSTVPMNPSSHARPGTGSGLHFVVSSRKL